MGNAVLIILLVCILGGAGFFICRERRKGKTCIGCPYANSCRKNSCSSEKDRKS